MIQFPRTLEQGPTSERQRRISTSPIRPEDAPRPLWYRVAGALEPLRPLFTWAVAHNRQIKRYALPFAAATTLAIIVRRRFGQHQGK